MSAPLLPPAHLDPWLTMFRPEGLLYPPSLMKRFRPCGNSAHPWTVSGDGYRRERHSRQSQWYDNTRSDEQWVVIAYQALDGQIHAESSFLLRFLMAWLANPIAFVPILLGMILLVLPGIYVLIRLFLATPAVMIDGYDPFEALSESWQLMDRSILSTAVALVIVGILGFAVLFPLIFLTRSSFVTNIVASLIVGTLSAGIQAFLYLELAEPS